MADAQCVIRSSQLSAWQSMYQHYVSLENMHACRPLATQSATRSERGPVYASQFRQLILSERRKDGK